MIPPRFMPPSTYTSPPHTQTEGSGQMRKPDAQMHARKSIRRSIALIATFKTRGLRSRFRIITRQWSQLQMLSQVASLLQPTATSQHSAKAPLILPIILRSLVLAFPASKPRVYLPRVSQGSLRCNANPIIAVASTPCATAPRWVGLDNADL